VNINDSLSFAAFAASANSSPKEKSEDVFQLYCASDQDIFLPGGNALLVGSWPSLRYQLYMLGKVWE